MILLRTAHNSRRALQSFGALALLCCTALASCSFVSLPASKSIIRMLGTTSTITIHNAREGANLDRAFQRSFDRITEIHASMSLQEPSSEINKVNNLAGQAAVSVSEDTFLVISAALDVARASGGAFDPTVGPIVNLWDITGKKYLPTAEEVAAVLPFVDYRQVEIDPAARSVKLLKAGMQIDLGAIAKGYAADEVAEVLREEGVDSAIIDLGGNIYVLGSKPDGTPWRVAVQNPFLTRGTYLASYLAVDESVVSSGDYERYFEQDGVRYHHIFDTRTGYPARPSVASVTILAANSSMLADAYATAAFVLGPEAGRQFLESVAGVEGVFVLQNGGLAGTSGVEHSERFRILDESFTWID